MPQPVNFYSGTYEDYKQHSIINKENGNSINNLYFCEDLKVLIRGDQIIPVPYVSIVNNIESIVIKKDNRLYASQTGQVYIDNDDNLTLLSSEPIDDLLYINNETNEILLSVKHKLISIFGANVQDVRDVQLLKNAYYNSSTKMITLEFITDRENDEELTISFSVKDLLDIYEAEDTSSIQMLVTEPEDADNIDIRKIKANIKLSIEENNVITIKEDGLHVLDVTIPNTQFNSPSFVGIPTTEYVTLGEELNDKQIVNVKYIKDYDNSVQQTFDSLNETINLMNNVLSSEISTLRTQTDDALKQKDQEIIELRASVESIIGGDNSLSLTSLDERIKELEQAVFIIKGES